MSTQTNRYRRTRRAFTLVELLVVISIIGMIIALLLPAVQQAREAGRRNTCNNNLRNCALAVANFTEAKRNYPGLRQPMEVTMPGATSPVQIPVSWVVAVSPYLERGDIYQAWRNPQQAAGAGISWPPQVYLEVVNCPSSLPSDRTKTPCVFVVNSGMADHYPLGPGTAGPNPGDWQANGIFFNQYFEIQGQTAPAPFCSDLNKFPMVYTSQEYVTVNDGSSMTLMLSENNNVPSFAIDFVAPTGLSGGPASWGDPPTAAYEKQGCFVWWPDKKPDPAMKINGLEAHNSSSSSEYYYFFLHPASNHPGGVNVAFCDGHARFVSDTIDYFVFCLLMSPNNRQCNTPGCFWGLDGNPGVTSPAWATSNYPSGTNNYAYLRTALIDDSQIP